MSEMDKSFEEMTGAAPVLYLVEQKLGARRIDEAEIRETYTWALEQAREICTEGTIATSWGDLMYQTDLSPARTYTARNGRQVELRLMLSKGPKSLWDKTTEELVELAIMEGNAPNTILYIAEDFIGTRWDGLGNPADLDLMAKAIEFFKMPQAEVNTPEIVPIVEVDPSTTFSDYMRNLMYQTKAKKVVEVGPDHLYRDAMDLSRGCDEYIGVSLPDFVERSKGGYEMAVDMGGLKMTLIPGNALELSKLVPGADLVFIKNAALEKNNGDMMRLMQHQRGEVELGEDDVLQIRDGLEFARRQALNEALLVAQKGCLVTFYRQERSNDFYELLVSELGVPADKIHRQTLRYDAQGTGDEDEWEALIVDNRLAN